MLQIPSSVATNVFVRAAAIYVCGFLFFLLMCAMASAQSYTSTSATTAWNASRWNNSADAAPYASAYTVNNAVSFTSGTYSIAGMGGAINVGNITVANGVTVNFTAASSTFQTAGTVRTINVGSGGTLDFSNQNFSTATGVGFIKNGAGVLALAGNTYPGGFTLNAGTVILRGVNAMGAGALTINGGTIAANNSRDLSGKYTSGITIGGDVQFGEMSTNVSLASSTSNLTLSNNMALGAATRTLTLGNGGNVAFGGVISNTSGGITFAATAGGTGRFNVTNAANTFTGDITITGGEVRFTADGSLGNAANDIIIDGGRFATLSGASYTLGAGRQIFVGDAAGTSISTPGAGVLTYNAAIADKSGETGTWAKQGGGTLALGGVSTYTGDTAINNGTVQLTMGNDRLPTTTTVSLGQAASANLGIFDLNGRSQEIAGLTSVTGTNATASNNTVTSASPATLTLGGSGAYSYGDGTDANSGVITGSIALVKNGLGTQTFGETNSYTGKTMIHAGAIAMSGESALGANPAVFTADQITLDGGGIQATGNIAFDSNRGVTLGASGGTIDSNGNRVTLTNIVTGNGNLTKSGAGTLVLSGAHTYTGSTILGGGTLQVGENGAGKTGTGDVTVNGSGAVLSGSGSIEGITTSVILGIIKPGDLGGSSTGALATKTLVFTPVSNTIVAELQIASAFSFDFINISGDLTLNSSSNIAVNGTGYSATVGDTFTLLDWSGVLTTNGFGIGTNQRTGKDSDGNEGNLDLPDISGVGFWEISGFSGSAALTLTVVPVVVPEPSRVLLLLIGGVFTLSRRRQIQR
jgi:fibronectin-binding autotransporter adhesin